MPATFDTVRKIALSIDHAEEGTSYGTPAFKVGGKLFARQHVEPDWLVLATTFEEREELMAADPDTYFITDHYLKYPWVLVRMSRIHRDALGDLVRRAARVAAGAKSKSTKARKR
jgi:hypothetical protein